MVQHSEKVLVYKGIDHTNPYKLTEIWRHDTKDKTWFPNNPMIMIQDGTLTKRQKFDEKHKKRLKKENL